MSSEVAATEQEVASCTSLMRLSLIL
jgi:hypothetical protein